MQHVIAQALDSIAFADAKQAQSTLESFQEMGVPVDLVGIFLQQLTEQLVQHSEVDRVLACTHRFLTATRSPQACLALFEREPESLSQLLDLFATSQYLADLLIRDPDAFDVVRLTGGQPVEFAILRDEILAEVRSANDIRSVRCILREYRHRETLRIAYGDFIGRQAIDVVIQQISKLAECLVEAAIAGARIELERRDRATPVHGDGRPVAFVALALGKLGGNELNYSSDIDLVFVRETWRAPSTRSKLKESHVREYFERLGQLVLQLLGDSTADGTAYRVDMRLRPHGKSGPLVVSYAEAIGYYDSLGRTWERQAFVKARSIAGDIELGRQLLRELEPWIYRRYLMRADITGLVALKRRIEHRSEAGRSGGEINEQRVALGSNLKLGFGGIRDIEYAIQFLQLLHAADQPELRCQSTLEAIRRLQAGGCITAHEQAVLEENYRFLRKIEHHLQIMFNRQTHSLPTDPREFAHLAARIDEQSMDADSASAVLLGKLSECTQRNRQILNHLLHDAFANHDAEEQMFANAECDLLLDPEPSAEVIEKTLTRFGFRDCAAAYRHLQDLAVESIAFLSTRRSRHFLAAIAPKLLAAIGQTPDPDATLISLANVASSLGGKAVLWELFSANPPSMELCIRICAVSPYLTSILTGNPGMIDELLDSLMVDHLLTYQEMAEELDKLCRGASDIAPMLHSYKNSMHLSVGVREILGKCSLEETHHSLSDVAEACMDQVIHHEFHRLVHKLGVPTKQSQERVSSAKATPQAVKPGRNANALQYPVAPAELVVIAVGKLGGREPNYHSDIDLIFLFDGEGETKSLIPNRRFESTTNRHFFNQLCQRVIHAVTRSGATGRLYDVDMRLRPLGRAGQLAITVDDFQKYFESGGGQIWERQALCKARPIWGHEAAREYAMRCVRNVLTSTELEPLHANEIYEHRLQLQQGASGSNLKRGIGGTMDVEFIVQLLQLAHVRERPEILVPNTIEALDLLGEFNLLPQNIAHELKLNYQFLRSVESGIRLMNLSARHELPTTPSGLQELSFLLRAQNRVNLPAEQIVTQCDAIRARCRELFESSFSPWMNQELEGAGS